MTRETLDTQRDCLVRLESKVFLDDLVRKDSLSLWFTITGINNDLNKFKLLLHLTSQSAAEMQHFTLHCQITCVALYLEVTPSTLLIFTNSRLSRKPAMVTYILYTHILHNLGNNFLITPVLSSQASKVNQCLLRCHMNQDPLAYLVLLAIEEPQGAPAYQDHSAIKVQNLIPAQYVHCDDLLLLFSFSYSYSIIQSNAKDTALNFLS